MARNKYQGFCYKCGELVKPGYGHFERYKGHLRIQCVKCASGRIITENDPMVMRIRKQLDLEGLG